MSDPLELELRMVVDHYVGTENLTLLQGQQLIFNT